MVLDISHGLQSTISTVTAARTFATDPRNIVTLTSSHLNWVRAGLKKKYGKSLWKETDEILKQNKLRWMEAQQLITSGDNWDQALMRCHTIFEEILELAVMNDLIDYDVFDESITSRLFGGANAAETGE
jgi:hypothetical protein